MAAAKLYVIHGSHPCRAVERALKLKRIDYTTSEYLPPMHVGLQRLRFGVRTVPAIRFADGEKLAGSRAIMRRLEERAPQPPLYPAEPAARARADEAERWGDEVLQPLVRRVLWQALTRSPRAMKSFQEGSKLPSLPMPVLLGVAPLMTLLERRLNGASEAAARADLQALPDHLDRIDAWLAEGVLGTDPPGAADLQIASSLRLLLTLGDLRPLVDGHEAGPYARRLFADHPGDVPAGALPAA